MIPSETERLFFRPLNQDDLHLLHDFNNDPLVAEYFKMSLPFPIEQTKEWLDKTLKSYQMDGIGHLAVHLKENGDFIGRCGLRILEVEKYPENNCPKWFWYRDSAPKNMEIDRHIELGYAYKSEYWGKGYATEAARAFCGYGFEHGLSNRIVAAIFPDNIASGKVLGKVGFKETGKAFGLDMELTSYTLIHSDTDKNKPNK
jgi:RimJ/RimL family protein N-acetyltransferase